MSTNVTPIAAGKPSVAKRLRLFLTDRQPIARPITPGELETEMQALLDGPLADPEILAELVRGLSLEDGILFTHYKHGTQADPLVRSILATKAKRAASEH